MQLRGRPPQTRAAACRQVTERIEKKQCQVSDGLFPKSLFAWPKTFFDKSKACYRPCQNSPSGLKQLTSPNLPLRQDLSAKKRFDDRSKKFLCGERSVRKMNIETRNLNDGLHAPSVYF
ncbi:MAG: hypothetical protein DRH10_08070 [Deltaproteobacteria bacterium]|nr:MAG: hypothetical protein DRH10_08070 [Deltaproteobacteria bacterium]